MKKILFTFCSLLLSLLSCTSAELLDMLSASFKKSDALIEELKKGLK